MPFVVNALGKAPRLVTNKVGTETQSLLEHLGPVLTAEGAQTTYKTRRRFAAARGSLTPMTSHDPTALSNYFDLQSCNTTDEALESSSRAHLVPSAVVGLSLP
ncbi:hypothetical protein CGMCC3_g13777 [Colletotrichum fructicola]|nr:uncharacterized protein CGMCC3_g13777 [Colletotrichum fructicola]KAE9570198.1 hypothetical protein CGMCC3_g13777 [Colletotrichum fructicola]